jgi:hypothetical protein
VFTRVRCRRTRNAGDLITLSRPYLPRELMQIICQQLAPVPARLIAALGIAEVTLRWTSPVADRLSRITGEQCSIDSIIQEIFRPPDSGRRPQAPREGQAAICVSRLSLACSHPYTCRHNFWAIQRRALKTKVVSKFGIGGPKNNRPDSSCNSFQIPCSPLGVQCKFPVLSQKFPVRLSREFCYKPLNLLACQRSKSHQAGDFDEIPC